MKLTDIKGISEKRAKDLNKANIFTAEDLVRFYPRAYLDLTHTVRLSECYHNDVVLVSCRVSSPPQTVTNGRRSFIKVWCEEGKAPFSAIWFNAPYVRDKLKCGVDYLFYGRVQNKYGAPSMINPSFEPLDKNDRLKGIVPVYSLRGSLTQRAVRDAVSDALKKITLREAIPVSLQNKYGLSDLARAYRAIHSPASFAEKDAAAERIALEEYFILISAFKVIKGRKDDARVRSYSCTAADVKKFCARFDFPLTEGQKCAVNEIFANLHSPHRMNRLLQGDVGSGKTAVALCSIYMALKSGYQAAMLAPTEVLAEQNYKLISRFFPEYKAGFLSGSSGAKYAARMPYCRTTCNFLPSPCACATNSIVSAWRSAVLCQKRAMGPICWL